MTQALLSVLQHALGLDQHGCGNSLRDHFVCGEGHDDYPTCVDAVAAGLMIRRESAMFGENGSLFRVTAAGKAWVAANSPPPPKLSPSQARYRRYLDADSSLSFRVWLRSARTEIPF